MGSMSSMEVNVDMLEQMDLMDISDQEALDVFLNSGSEDNTALSPVLGKGPKPTALKMPVPGGCPQDGWSSQGVHVPVLSHQVWSPPSLASEWTKETLAAAGLSFSDAHCSTQIPPES